MKAKWPVVLGASVVFVLIAWLVWPTQWRYDQVQQGRETSLVRTNRFTGRSERLSRKGWIPMDFAVTFSAPTSELPPADLAKLQTQATIDGTELTIALHNGTDWRIATIVASVQYEGDPAPRRYTLYDTNLYADILGGLAPNSSTKFSVDLGLDPQGRRISWELVGATGRRP